MFGTLVFIKRVCESDIQVWSKVMPIWVMQQHIVQLVACETAVISIHHIDRILRSSINRKMSPSPTTTRFLALTVIEVAHVILPSEIQRVCRKYLL
jgi:hypothetical protein